MSFWKQHLISPVCLKCGSFFCGPALFCNACYSSVIDEKLCAQAESRSHVGRAHIYLLEWIRGDSDELSELVYRLKSDTSAGAWQHYSRLLYSRLCERTAVENFCGLVPIPGSNCRSVHALLFAQNLAALSGLPVYDVLIKSGGTRQKSLSAEEREKTVSIQLRDFMAEDFTNSKAGSGKYIFVDDVLTTGQSFKQASRALSCHPDSLIVTLFYRSKSAG